MKAAEESGGIMLLRNPLLNLASICSSLIMKVQPLH